MQVSVVLAFAGFATMLIVVPGPDWAFVLAAGVRGRVVVPAVAGLAAGYVLLTAVVAAGVGPLVASVPSALIALTVVGALYLLYLGIGILRAPGEGQLVPIAATRAPARAGSARTVRRGIGVSALNPKGLLFFVAFLPQFARPDDSWPLPLQLVVLGAVWTLIVALFYTALGFTAERALAARPGLARVAGRVAGGAMIAVALALVGEQVLAAR
jgi:threonine/homoserine/homoserine lactone efflux protein